MKKIIAVLFGILMLTTSAFAYELPKSFWKPNDSYVAALGSGDAWGIIDSGIKILNAVANEPENQQILEIRASRTEQIGLAYEKVGDYVSAAKYFALCSEYSNKIGWIGPKTVSDAKVLHYSNDVRIYKETDSTVITYNARLEPNMGVLYGLTSDSPSKASVPGRSAILLYHAFGDTSTGWMEKILQEAEANGQAVDFAWNVPGEGSQISSVSSQQSHIIDILQIIERYNTVPVYIRFGSEVNIWGNKPNPSEYIEAFRLVTNLVRQYTTNTAMVWSVNECSGWLEDMNDYYPGDEYVDWVGVSLYTKKYFQGRNDWTDANNEVLFNTGKNADPVKALNEVMMKYGARKPVMLAESGVSHTIRTLGERDTLWAKTYMSKLMHYVPMVYPQIKLMCYFDRVIDSEHSDYALSSNNEMLWHYAEQVKAPHFAQNGAEDSATTYSELRHDYVNVSTKDDLYTYAHAYGYDNPSVSYYIDGVLAHTSYEIPHKFSGMKNVTPGNHLLTVKVEANGWTLSEKSVWVTVSKDISIIINGSEVETDTAPVIVNGRTLVPIRVVANGLLAEVEWIAETREVIITRGSDILKLQIDNLNMTKNGAAIPLDTAPTIINGRTMVPIRAIGEAFAAFVDWDAANRSVIING